VYGYSVGGQWTQDREFSEHEFKPAISVAELAADPEFKTKTLAELKTGPDKLELKPMVRKYVECLSTIHHEFRALTKSAVDQQLRTIADSKARLFASFPGVRDIALAVYLADDDGLKIGEETGLSATMERYLEFLRAKNNHLVNFARRRVAY
jgi:hypothetical protein